MICPKCKSIIKIRSRQQQGYYWGVILKYIADETGNNAETVHEEMKRMYLKIGEKRLGNRIVDVTRSTSDLTTVETEEYYSKIRSWAGSKPEDGGLGIMIPLPNEELQSA